MIETDEEIAREMQRLNYKKKEIQKEVQFRKFMNIFHCIVIIFVLFFIIVTNLANFITNTIILGIFITAIFWILFYLELRYYSYENEYINKLYLENEKVNSEINKVGDFWSYLTSYRKMEAIQEKNIIIYPELYECDAQYIIKNLKSIYENERIKYEEQHMQRLKLNPYILDKKLEQAPIEAYPINEQLLLIERQQELNDNKLVFNKHHSKI